jgi:hypothetical protein
MACVGPGGAGDDVEFLGGHGRAGQHHAADAAHRLIDAGRHAQVTGGDLGAGLGQRLGRGLRRVPHQHPDGRVPLAEQAGRLGAGLPGCCHENHDEPLPSPRMGYRTHSGQRGCPLGSLAGQLAETDAQARALIAAGFGQWSAAISGGLRRLHAAGHLPDGTDPDDLAVPLLAALQGGLLLAQVQRDTRPLETAVDTVLKLARLSRRDVPADGDTPISSASGLLT